jgi:acetyl-CoA synthetase
MFGVAPQIVDAEGSVLEGPTEGNLCITQSWPGQMRTVYGDHAPATAAAATRTAIIG